MTEPDSATTPVQMPSLPAHRTVAHAALGKAFLLKFSVQSFRNRERAIVQYRTEQFDIGAFKSFLGRPRRFPSRGISFHHKDDAVSHLTEQNRVRAGTNRRRVDQNIVKFFPELHHP